jgi:hypothetical protein
MCFRGTALLRGADKQRAGAIFPSSAIYALMVCFLIADCLLAGCVIETPPRDSDPGYPAVAAGEGQTFAGTVEGNPARGTAYLDLQGDDAGTHCRGEGHLLKRHAFTCTGAMGVCRLRCDDGAAIECRYQLRSCVSGYGIGLSADRKWFAFSFGPDMSGLEGQNIAVKLAHYIASLPNVKASQKHGTGASTGTGFFVSRDGFIVSAFHVVRNARKISVVMRSGESLPADVKGSDEANDIALLKVRHNASPLPIVSSKDVVVGDRVFTIGYPLVDIEGQEQKTTFGQVNALSGIRDDVRFVQIDVPIQPGNSGGPLIDSHGRVVGIVARTLDPVSLLQKSDILPQNANYAVKSDYVLPLMIRYDVEPAGAHVGVPDQESAMVKHVRDAVVMVVAQ